VPSPTSSAEPGDISTATPRASRRALSSWLGVVWALVVAMVVLGGVTRLTGSGLSIVEWKPVVGAIPPLTSDDWQKAFRAYQETPQYRLQNAGMSLDAFQRIFFWEYIHRLVGRLLGIAFLVPLAWFAATRSIPPALGRRLGLVGVLGLLQGGMGWFMVKSGLVAAPNVSHLRLAAHLTLALVVLSALFWTWMDLREPRDGRDEPVEPVRPRLRFALHGVTSLLALQIVYGAFTAGLHAGVGYNTFPKMHGRWIPPDAFALAPTWRNLVDNPAAVQLSHRAIGALLVVAIACTAWLARGAPARVRAATAWVAAGAVVQFGLGVATLLLVVPVSVAAIHQLGACLLLLAVLRAQHAATDARAPGHATVASRASAPG
jgi:cytochrome c oxidase assembly protein subunit 15